MGSGQTGKCFEELGRPIIYSVDWKMHHIEMHFSCSQSPSTSPFPPPQPLLFVKYKHKYINNEHSSEMHLLIPDDPNSLPPYLPPLSHSVPAIYQSWKKRAWSAFAELFFIAFFFFRLYRQERYQFHFWCHPCHLCVVSIELWTHPEWNMEKILRTY